MGVIGYGLGVIGAGLAIGLSALGATGAMARQPEVQGRVFTVFIMGSAFGEALALLLQFAEADIQKALWELPLLTGIHLLM